MSVFPGDVSQLLKLGLEFEKAAVLSDGGVAEALHRGDGLLEAESHCEERASARVSGSGGDL